MAIVEDTALLITASRDLAIGLAALLLSIPPLRHVERVHGPTAFRQRLATDRQPALLVLDTDQLGEATSGVIETMRAVSPETRCLILSNSVAESRELASSGIEPVVIKGADPVGLVATITNLLGDTASSS